MIRFIRAVREPPSAPSRMLFERVNTRVPALADGLADAEREGRIGMDRLRDASGELV